MNSKDSKTPEWSIFDRLEELEDITLQLMGKTDAADPKITDISTKVKQIEKVEAIALDAARLAALGVLAAFVAIATDESTKARIIKDTLLVVAKHFDITLELRQWLATALTGLCDDIEGGR